MNTAPRTRVLALIYAATIFVSAFLLFQVQPMVSKFILPWFGGTPAVWTTCMLFFQMLLFAGYSYAHASQAWLRPRQQALLHLAVIVVAGLLVLWRVLPSPNWAPANSNHPIGQILLLLILTIGFPYFVLSTTGPLIQAWFARSFPGISPYRLFALSNLGSLLALLSYPVLFERWFSLPTQAAVWATGFVAFVVFCGYAAVCLLKSPLGTMEEIPLVPAQPEGASAGDATGTRPGFLQIAAWLFLPALASVALLATTNHVCADFTPMPFLWIVPLSLYLITFIIAFGRPFEYPGIAAAVLLSAAVFTLVMVYFVGLIHDQGFGDVYLFNGKSFTWIRSTLENWNLREPGTTSMKLDVGFISFLVFNFSAMAGICLLCHGELARCRPHPRYLTLYYLMISAGGALGGIAVGLVAPQVFTTYFEWELSIFAGCLLGIWIIMRSLVHAVFAESEWPIGARAAIFLPIAISLMLPAAIEIVDLVQFMHPSTDKSIKLAVRNFFGALTVRERDAGDAHYNNIVLRHGAITHGTQFIEAERRGQPTTYYGTVTGVGRTLNYYRSADRPSGVRVGAVGLGTGTLAAYVGNGDSISFYEINQAVIDITEGGKWFTYLQDAKQRGANYQIKLGDARLTLKRELDENQPQHFHVIVIDAFSGDAIPAHLLTEEAFEIYVKHLATAEADGLGGAIAVHISNRYVDLDPVVRGAARRFNLLSARIENEQVPQENVSGSTWIILTRNESLIAALKPHTSQPSESREPILWTDTNSNLFEILKDPPTILRFLFPGKG